MSKVKTSTLFDKSSVAARLFVVGLISIGVVAVALTAFNSFSNDLHSGQIIKLIEHIKKACEAYYFDVGSFAMEYSDVAYSTYLAHNLSRPTGSEQWNGPYIRQVLTNHDNPFGGSIRVYNYIDYANGFDLDADDIIDTHGEGNFIVLLNVPFRVAKKVNDRLDSQKETKNWMTSGKVKYYEKSARLSVYLAGG